MITVTLKLDTILILSAYGSNAMVSRSNIAAFSLIEVVIALGVVSFAILPMVALLPLGMTTYHDSTEIYLSAQARQLVLNDLQQAGLSLPNGATTYGETNYYDGEGSLLSQVTPSGTTTFSSASPVYQMAVTVSTLKGGHAISLPQSDASVPTSAATLSNSAIVSTQFSRVNSQANSTTGGSTFRMGTDYLFYNRQQ